MKSVQGSCFLGQTCAARVEGEEEGGLCTTRKHRVWHTGVKEAGEDGPGDIYRQKSEPKKGPTTFTRWYLRGKEGGIVVERMVKGCWVYEGGLSRKGGGREWNCGSVRHLTPRPGSTIRHTHTFTSSIKHTSIRSYKEHNHRSLETTKTMKNSNTKTNTKIKTQ